MSQLYDITRPVRRGIAVWPGDARYAVDWTLRLDRGDSVNLAAIRLSPHTGTHADGGYHFDERGEAIGSAPLSAFLGPARLVDVRGREAIDVPQIEAALAAGPIERLLFRTGAWTSDDEFPRTFAALTAAAAERIAAAGVVLVGTDAPSVDPFDSTELAAHHVLGRERIAILESLLLDDVPEGDYELIALPLRLEEADASPVRAVLRRS